MSTILKDINNDSRRILLEIVKLAGLLGEGQLDIISNLEEELVEKYPEIYDFWRVGMNSEIKHKQPKTPEEIFDISKTVFLMTLKGIEAANKENFK
jgi:hypothetical protein